MRRKLGIVGFYGGTNLGDESILTSLLLILQKNFPNLSVRIYSFGDLYLSYLVDKSKIEIYLLRSLKKDIIKILLSLKDLDTIIIGGGGLFHDYQFKVILEYFLWGLMAKLLRKKIICIGVGIGPLRKKTSRFLFGVFVKDICDEIQVRDKGSYQLTLSIINQNISDKVKLSYDLALYLDNIRDKYKKNRKESPYVVIAFRYWGNSENNYVPQNSKILKKYVSLIKYILENSDFDVKLVPFSINRDIPLISDLYNFIKDDRVKIAVPSNLDDLFYIISNSKAVIGLRLHSLILSLVFRIPFFGIIYDDKVRNFMEEFNSKNYISIDELYSNEIDTYYRIKEFLFDLKFLIDDNLIKNCSIKVEEDVVDALRRSRIEL